MNHVFALREISIPYNDSYLNIIIFKQFKIIIVIFMIFAINFHEGMVDFFKKEGNSLIKKTENVFF